jgi:hypothetical protein
MLVKPTVKSRTQPTINERADVLHLSNGMIVQHFREEGERTIGAALLNLRILKRSFGCGQSIRAAYRCQQWIPRYPATIGIGSGLQILQVSRANLKKAKWRFDPIDRWCLVNLSPGNEPLAASRH